MGRSSMWFVAVCDLDESSFLSLEFELLRRRRSLVRMVIFNAEK